MNLLSYSRRGRPATYRHALGQAFIDAVARRDGSLSREAVRFLDVARGLTTSRLKVAFTKLPTATQRDVLSAVSAG
jgi:hypothetical protein